eukprot:7245286-Prymnesium_polylepis.2
MVDSRRTAHAIRLEESIKARHALLAVCSARARESKRRRRTAVVPAQRLRRMASFATPSRRRVAP